MNPYYDCEVFFPREMDSLEEAEKWASSRSALWHMKIEVNLKDGGRYSCCVKWNNQRFSECTVVLREINPGEFTIVSFHRITAGSPGFPFTRLHCRDVLKVK